MGPAGTMRGGGNHLERAMISMPLNLWPKYFSGAAWQESFAFLETLGPMSAPQDYVSIRGDAIFARVMRYPTRTPQQAIVEAHREYIDIQMSLLHSEGIRWYDPAVLRIKSPYDAQKDAEFYEVDAPHSGEVINHPGICTVLFPEDPHMPQLITGDQSVEILKAVVKVRVSLVR